MDRNEIMEDFKKRAIAMQGFLEHNFGSDRMRFILDAARGNDKEAKKRLKRELEIMKYEIDDMNKAVKRMRKIL